MITYNGASKIIKAICTALDVLDTRVPEPQAGDASKYLKGNGTWDTPEKTSVTVTQVVSTGQKIASIDVDGTNTDLYAPSGGGGGGNVVQDGYSFNLVTGHPVLFNFTQGSPYYPISMSIPIPYVIPTGLDVTATQSSFVIKYFVESYGSLVDGQIYINSICDYTKRFDGYLYIDADASLPYVSGTEGQITAMLADTTGQIATFDDVLTLNFTTHT